MKNVLLLFTIAVLIVFLVSCGPSNDLSGEYDCIEHFSDDMVGKVSLELTTTELQS